MSSYVPLCINFKMTSRKVTATATIDNSDRKKLCSPETLTYIRGERERLFGSREREGKLKIPFPFHGKGTGIRKLLREGKGNLRLVIPGIPGNPGNHKKQD